MGGSHTETIGPVTQSGEPLVGSYFVAAYPPFSQWTVAALDPYRHRLTQPHASPARVPLGLYVHIPFCTERCQYCYYLSYAGKTRDQIDAYLDALLVELATYARQPALAGRMVDFVYFGGGTPSLLSPWRIRRLLGGLAQSFPWNAVREVTFESAPKTVTLPKLVELRQAGVTRLSLGVQQLDDEVLAKNGRIHSVRDVERAYADIQRAAFDVVNIDLMAGMVGETDESFYRSLDRVVEMAPDSVTVYQLEIPPNTPLSRAIRERTLQWHVPSWEVTRSRVNQALTRLEHAGYKLRSAYAAVRDIDRHRFLYMEEQYRGSDLLGIGVSSFSYLNGVHHQNLASFEPYIQSLRAGTLPFGRAYVLNDQERLVREFVLQLKLGRIEQAYFRDKFGVEVDQQFAEQLSRFSAQGWLEGDATSITLTRQGLLRVDRMIPSFYLPRHRGVPYS
jgi:oxygen-independent coproporphyrinogen-3 oxidase